jgi:DNA-binding MarR family transcriptional regulator
LNKEYLELTHLIARLHRRSLDVLRAELNRIGVRDINGVQALLLANIGDEKVVIKDLVERGYYQGSNVSYNIKKLMELEYIDQERSTHDKRSVSVSLTDKGHEVVVKVREMEDLNAAKFIELMESDTDLATVLASLRRLERMWTDYIHYGD